MGANQSANGHSNPGDNSGGNAVRQPSGILVVNPTPGSGQTGQEQQIVLPKRVLPVLTIEGSHIDPQRHRPNLDQLSPALWNDFASILGEFAASRSELTAVRQNQLQEKIGQIDDHVQRFTDSYVNDKHKALARMNDDSRKLDEIEKQLEKCSLQAELCISMLNKLNFLLPDNEKLETLEQS